MPETVRQDPPSTSEFVQEFQATTLSSAIPDDEYVDWEYIDGHIESARSFEQQENLAAYTTTAESDAAFLSRLEDLRSLDRSTFIQKLSNILLDVQPAKKAVRVALSLIGDTNDTFVVKEYAREVDEIASDLEGGKREEAEKFATVLTNLGLRHLINQGHQLDSVLTGVRLGLESHRRKNRQGNLYMRTIEQALDEVVAELEAAGVTASYKPEEKVDLNAENKQLDFLFFINGRPRIGFELNCYKARGSKPSEIKRAYQKLAERMNKNGLALIWVTDGFAWKGPLERVLDEAYESHKDMYNYEMVKEDLAGDILGWLGEQESSASVASTPSPQSGLDDFSG